MRKKWMEYVCTAVGILLAGAGIVLLKWQEILPDGMRVLPYVGIGIGCGLFGQGMGSLISRRTLRNAPDVQKQMEIEKNDERNVALSCRAKARAFDLMLYLFGALMVSYALMGVELPAVLLLVGAYLLVTGSFIYYLQKYEREM